MMHSEIVICALFLPIGIGFILSMIFVNIDIAIAGIVIGLVLFGKFLTSKNWV